jgi:hypothetical protein
VFDNGYLFSISSLKFSFCSTIFPQKNARTTGGVGWHAKHHFDVASIITTGKEELVGRQGSHVIR